MNIYKPPEVDEEPYVQMVRWSVRQLPGGDRHLVGVVVGGAHDGRVTSKIKYRIGRVFTTNSGRRYELVGPPSFSLDAEYVWNIWCAHNNTNPQALDVSQEYA